METHQGKWPQNWDELQEAEKSIRAQGRNLYWNFDEVKKIIKIDWSFKPENWLATQTNENDVLQVVTLLNGRRIKFVWGTDHDPNRNVANYLKKKKTERDAVLRDSSKSVLH